MRKLSSLRVILCGFALTLCAIHSSLAQGQSDLTLEIEDKAVSSQDFTVAVILSGLSEEMRWLPTAQLALRWDVTVATIETVDLAPDLSSIVIWEELEPGRVLISVGCDFGCLPSAVKNVQPLLSVSFVMTAPFSELAIEILPEIGGIFEDTAVLNQDIEWVTPDIVNGVVTTQTFVRGDLNEDRSVNIADASFVLNFMFTGGRTPDCLDMADANDDGRVNIADPVRILQFVFRNGPPPPPPFESRGLDPTEDKLVCPD